MSFQFGTVIIKLSLKISLPEMFFKYPSFLPSGVILTDLVLFPGRPSVGLKERKVCPQVFSAVASRLH